MTFNMPGMFWFWFLQPTVGALIGWITNRIAIRLLFRPREPVRVPIFSWTLQGLLPRRRNELARLLGETVERELLDPAQILEAVLTPETEKRLRVQVREAVRRYLDESMPPFLPAFLRPPLRVWVEQQVDRHLARFLREELPDMLQDASRQLPLARMAEERLRALSLDELEALVMRLGSTELRHIEWMGAILGALIGLFQALLMTTLLIF